MTLRLGHKAVRHSDPQMPFLNVSLPDFILLVLIGAFFTARRSSNRLEEAWARVMRRTHSRLGRVLLVAFGSQVGMLVLLAGLASLLACWVGAADWVFGINFLFAFTWTELLDVTEKLFEAADEFQPR